MQILNTLLKKDKKGDIAFLFLYTKATRQTCGFSKNYIVENDIKTPFMYKINAVRQLQIKIHKGRSFNMGMNDINSLSHTKQRAMPE